MANINVPCHEAKFTDRNGAIKITRVPVVQELARQGLDQFPERFMIRGKPTNGIEVPFSPADNDDDNCHEFSAPIPTIDMSKVQFGWHKSDNQGEELAKLADAAREWGMFLIKNHGIETKVLDDVKDVVKGFFGLPFEEKKASVGTYVSVDNMGYGRNYVKSDDQPLDWIDRLTMRAAPKDATKGLNVWPQNPPNFRQAMEKYLEEARKICNTILQALAEALSEDSHVFIKHFDEEKSEINIRVNYYPPCPRPDLALGISPHSDPSALSLLIQFDSSGGLQVFKDAKWLTVHWPVDALLVNLGDLMEIMSNGYFNSSWHRAITQRDAERVSLALFYNPPSESEIGPLKKRSDCNGYKKVVVGEYVQNYYKISPTVTKQGTKFAQL